MANAPAYSGRGNAWRDKGNYDRAITDYSESIRLNPKLHFAYVGRGSTWALKGDYDRAIADYDESIRVNPKDAYAYLSRGVTRFAQGRFEAAEADFSDALRLDPNNTYSVLWRYLAHSRAGHQAAADSELATHAAKVDKRIWPAPIIDLLAGTTHADGVLKAGASKDRGQMCNAAFFVGEWHLLQGRQSQARASLERAAHECPRFFFEYFSASAELKRLSQ